MEMKFYQCGQCGQIIAIVEGTDAAVICCGEPMKKLVPGTSDGAFEKHIPVYEVKDDHVYVTVGAEEHPMTADHYIMWVALKTKKGNQRKELLPGDMPKVCFALCKGDEVESVYAFCNIHGLWKG